MRSFHRLTRTQIAAVIVFILAVAAFRVLRPEIWPSLPNFSPVMAIAFCGGVFLPGVLAWIIPVAAVVISDLALAGMSDDYAVSGSWQLVSVVCLLAVVGLGRWMSRRESAGWGTFFGLVIASSLGFYLETNALAWAVMPAYPRTLAGFVQAQTVGLPGYAPSWMFLRNSLFSDLTFAAVILALRAVARRSEVPFAEPLHVEVRHQTRPS